MKLSEYVKQQLNEDGDMPGAPDAAAAAPNPNEPGANNTDTGTSNAGAQPPAPETDEIGKVVYTVEAVDREDKIKNLLNYIMGIGNQKRSFEIVIAPGDESIEKKFEWNGEGTDKIISVKGVKEGEEEGGEGGEPSTSPEDEAAATGQ